MPYAIKGKSVIKANTGELVGHSDKPKKYLRTLNAIDHGWQPKRKPRKGLWKSYHDQHTRCPGE